MPARRWPDDERNNKEWTMVSKLTSATILTGGLLALIAGAPAQAQWKPTKPVEFLGAAGPGGGTDIFNRTVQSIIQKYNLVEQPILVDAEGRRQRRRGLRLRQGGGGRPAQARLRHLQPLHAAAGRQGGVQAYRFRAGRRHGVRRVHPLEQGRLASGRTTSRSRRRRRLPTAPSRWPAPCPRTRTRP